MSSSSDDVIIVDVLERPTVKRISKLRNREPSIKQISRFSTESSDSDDCLIVDEDADREQVKTDDTLTTALPSVAENGYQSLRRSTRCHRKLNIPVDGLHKSTCVSTKMQEDKLQEPPKKKSRVMSSSSYQQQQQHVVNTRSVTRRLGSEGCVLDPPTPEDELEFREWPAEGMHERPVWPDPRYEIPNPPPQPASDLQVSVHHSLHAALAFTARVGTSLKDSGKIMLDKKLALLQNGDVSERVGESVPIHNLMELLMHTGLLYCTICSVSQERLATYIDSLTVETALKWFDEVENMN
ncbi:hypothetical protein L9F63_007498 [Diploptera punctata]|uniref:Uncharacterized protein n=1 Tax=Diploptera punctata TaxID=6984 RepID=A0AAD8E3V6_DIPPU|nr:hypothetical protein L9F63_007498 [Diploptera punctata]